MLNALGIQFARPEIPGHHRQTFSVGEGVIVVSPRESSHGGRLNFVIFGPDDLARAVHGDDGVVGSEFDHDASLVEPDGELGGFASGGEGPGAFHAVVEGGFGAVGGALPQPNGAVLGSGADEGEFGMEEDGANVVGVSLEGVDDGFGLVIPNLDGAIIGPGEDVGFVPGGIVINAVDAAFVSLQRVMGEGTAQPPHLDAAIERRGGKGVGILGVELDHHDVVGVSLKELGAVEATVPIPALDGHIIATRQKVGKGRMHLHVSNVIGVGLEVLNFLHGIVIVDPQSHIVARGHEPLLSRDEFSASDRKLGHLEGLDVGSGFVIPDGDVAGVECGEGP
mmetsp:Transcript_13695/g.29082  ORF Transcript_13695/g.29082 Transcript_13695/m.29082 type:complete len:337 (-) Transcript_13695:210-1220(-)